MQNINKLYTKLGKLTFCYINKKINFISYRKQAKQISSEIKKLKHEINNDIGKEEFTKEGYNIYKFCPKCQIGNNPNAKVCVNCGEKFNK